MYYIIIHHSRSQGVTVRMMLIKRLDLCTGTVSVDKIRTTEKIIKIRFQRLILRLK